VLWRDDKNPRTKEWFTAVITVLLSAIVCAKSNPGSQMGEVVNPGPWMENKLEQIMTYVTLSTVFNKDV
jgi:hypothetical protein